MTSSPSYHQYGFCMYGGIGTWPVVGYAAGSISFDWQGFPSLISNGTATLLGEHPLPLASVAALFVLYLWFWNQIFTWVGVSRIIEAKCSLSGALRYFCWRKRLSSSNVCALENSTRLFRFLCSVSWGWVSFACCSSSKSADSSSLHSWLASCFGGNDRSEMVGLVESGCCNTGIFRALRCCNVEEVLVLFVELYRLIGGIFFFGNSNRKIEFAHLFKKDHSKDLILLE